MGEEVQQVLGVVEGGVARIKGFLRGGQGGTTCVGRYEAMRYEMSYAPAMCARELAALDRVRKTESRGTV